MSEEAKDSAAIRCIAMQLGKRCVLDKNRASDWPRNGSRSRLMLRQRRGTYLG